MKTMTTKDIQELRNLIAQKTDRLESLYGYLCVLRKRLPNMSRLQLQITQAELADIDEEAKELKAFIENAKKEIASFYAPAIR